MSERKQDSPWTGKYAVCPVTKRQHPAWMLYCPACNKGKDSK